jgi:hypothetical protein
MGPVGIVTDPMLYTTCNFITNAMYSRTDRVIKSCKRRYNIATRIRNIACELPGFSYFSRLRGRNGYLALFTKLLRGALAWYNCGS